MRVWKKLLAWIFVFTLGFGADIMPCCAEGQLQDGLELSLTTDRESYRAEERIEVTFAVTNRNDFEISNVSLECLVPEPCQLTEGTEAEKTVAKLSPGETAALSVVYTYASGKDDGEETESTSGTAYISPKTATAEPSEKYALGAGIVFCGALAVLLFTGIRSKRGRRLLSLLLCTALSGAFLAGNGLEVRAASVGRQEASVSKNIAVDSENIALYAVVSYDGATAVDFALDVSGMEFHESEDGDFYILSRELPGISGTASGVGLIEEFTYGIRNYRGETLQEGTVDAAEVWSAPDAGFGYGGNVLTVTAGLRGGDRLTKEYIIVNFAEENVRRLGVDTGADTDRDGIPDYLEELLGTDPTKSDTDGDGLPDRVELLAQGLSPLLADSNEDGVADGDEDSDGDGLINRREYELGTSLWDADTDGDGLSDGDEVLVYLTDPLAADTDKDGIPDAREIEIGSDPLTPEEVFDYREVWEDEGLLAVPSIELTGVAADQVNGFYMNEVTDGLLADESIPGYIDSAFSFNEIGEFGEATLSFELAPELFEEENFQPAIYWFNEETQLLEKVEGQTLEGNVLSAGVTHFSKYIVLNSYKYEMVWEYDLLYEEEPGETFQGIDVAFVLDSSGSMTFNDPSDNRKQVTRGFIDRLTEQDLAAVVDFDDVAVVCSGFTNQKDILYGAVDSIDSDGGTDLSCGILAALELFGGEGYDGSDKVKYIVMLTDGDGSYDPFCTEAAKELGIVIYTVGLGDSVSTGVLSAMAEGTGGAYYHASRAEELNGIFELIADESDFVKDSDGDGICDYYEKEMAKGNLRLGTGVSLTGINYLAADSDGDGLTDGEELTVTKTGDRVYVRMKSNPTVADTDGDGMDDKNDPYPLVPDVIGDVLLYRSNHEEGKNPDGTVAEDMEYNDKDYAGLLAVDGFWMLDAPVTPEWMMWGEMGTLFQAATLAADQGVKNAAFEMMARFKSGAGGSYSNGDLTAAVRAHDRVTYAYMSIMKFVTDHLTNNGANVKALEYDLNSDVTKEYLRTIPKAYMNEWSDRVNGLGITIHDFSGYTVTITDFERDGSRYSGTLRFHYYDNFGLDSDDLSVAYGFIDWYTLQHYTRFNGAYRPFLTYVDFEVDFSGVY